MAEFFHNPAGPLLLGPYLIERLNESHWSLFRAAVAFVKYSGIRHIEEPLARFVGRNGRVRMSVGVDLHGTSREGLQAILDLLGPANDIFVFHNEAGPTFHPKIYVLSSPPSAEVVVGSGNLTESGLFTNYEGAIRLRLNLSNEEERSVYNDVIEVLDTWADPSLGTVRRLTPEFLDDLVVRGYVRDEAHSRPVDSREDAPEPGHDETRLFAAVPVRRPPRPSREPARPAHAAGVAATDAVHSHFVMVLQRTDAGTGQITPGASRRSPEIFIPLRAIRMDPGFWGYPESFEEDPAREGKLDRRGVAILFEGEVIEVNMMTWPVKHDFRLRSARLRDSANVGDILHLERTGEGNTYEYVAELIRHGSDAYGGYDSRSDQAVPNSQKRFGYY